MNNSYLDNPELDDTPHAQPSYWRGKAAGINAMLKIVADIVHGLDNGTGINNQPQIELMRRTLLEWRDNVQGK